MSQLSYRQPSFICTFCWTPQFLPSKPRVVGSVRIACAPCHAIILDLSICWVCGEMIVRGEDVVSLGWCFWHRACFGCLLCATIVDIPRDCDDGHKVELEHIPLCSVCEIETAGDNSDVVQEKGVEHVSLWDGGVSKARLQRIEKSRETGTSFDDSPTSVDDLKRHRRRRVNIRSSRSSSPMPEKLSMGEGEPNPNILGDDGSHDAVNGEQHIYLSILNPFGEPAFKPSPTKPLPNWMKYLPSNRALQQELHSSSTPTASTEYVPHSQHPSLTSTSSRIRAQTLRFEPGNDTFQPPDSPISRSRTFPRVNQATSISSARKPFVQTITPSTAAGPTFTREPNSFPFFQNPRQPILPGSDSSWGTRRVSSPFIRSREFVERIERKGSLVLSDEGMSKKFSTVRDGKKWGKGKEREVDLNVVQEADRRTDMETVNQPKERKEDGSSME